MAVLHSLHDIASDSPLKAGGGRQVTYIHIGLDRLNAYVKEKPHADLVLQRDSFSVLHWCVCCHEGRLVR